MKKIQRSTIVPLLLVVYLAVMSYIGYPEYEAGRMSALYYFGIIIVTLGIIIALRFLLKKRERLRKERDDDIKNNRKSL